MLASLFVYTFGSWRPAALLFIGATDNRRFRAFDGKTGEELWTTNVGQNINANPMSYRGKDGNQYVAVIANSQLVDFALPQEPLRRSKSTTKATRDTKKK